MDAQRFDRLAKTLGGSVTRRGALSGLLAGVVASALPDDPASAKRRRGNSKGQGQGNQPAKRRARRRGKDRKPQAGAEATRCCSTGNCTPGKGKNLQKCCYQGQNLTGKNFGGANLGSANFAGATLTSANFQGANLGKACFVDADLTGVRFSSSTNLDGVIICRTQADTGEDDSGCGRGTPCCPTCDADHPCDGGEVCCDGRCIEGDCCDNGEQSTCADSELCCGNTCVAGNCCETADCPIETCQRRSCQDNQCVYTPVSGEPGPRCQTICCEDEQGDPVCCDTGATLCGSTGVCGCAGAADCDTDAGEVCCDGTCQLPGWANLTTFGSPGNGPTEMLFVEDVAVSADQQTAWAADNENNRISIWTRQPDGSWVHQTTFGSPGGAGLNQVRLPEGVEVSADGLTVYVADTPNDRVSVWRLGCPA